MKNQKLTDNDIKKALECCQYEGVETCRDCPMFYTHEFDNEIDFDCGKYIYGRALDLINRLQAETKEKDDVIKAQADAIFLYEGSIKDKAAEIERYKGVIKLLEKDVQTAKSEAIKEFEQKIKAHAYYIDVPKEHRVVDEDDIDAVLKEMTEQ